MPDYVRIALEQLQNCRPTEKIDAPHECKEPVYGIKLQYADDADTAPLLSQGKKIIPNKLSEYFYVTHKRRILLLSQH